MNRSFFTIVLFLGVIVSAYYVYENYFSQEEVNDVQTAVADSKTFKVLPYGSDLDLTPISQYNPTLKTFTYPVLHIEDLGLSVDRLMRQPDEK